MRKKVLMWVLEVSIAAVTLICAGTICIGGATVIGLVDENFKD